MRLEELSLANVTDGRHFPIFRKALWHGCPQVCYISRGLYANTFGCWQQVHPVSKLVRLGVQLDFPQRCMP